MWVIIQWIKRYSYPLVSLTLFLISFNLVLQYQIYQHSLYFNQSVSFFRFIDQSRTNVTEYIGLKEQNQFLREENKKLREALKSNYTENSRTFDSIFTDTVSPVSRKILYKYFTAEVIKNSTTRVNNYFIINQGLKQGIEKGMAVLSPSGIAGIVVTTSENFSRVMSVLNSHFEITPYIPALNLRQGVVKWTGGNANIGQLNEISRTEPIKKGFEILSSNYSTIFPPGVPIGIVHSVSKPSQKEYQEVKINFATDFNRLLHVYCVKNMSSNELVKLDTNNEKND